MQGSYKSATNIFGDSDIDVVVELTSSFNRDVSALDAIQIESQRNAYQPATYQWPQFRADVLQTLQAYYGAPRIRQCDKCIKVDFGVGRIAADIVPAFQHKKYSTFHGTAPWLQASTDGIQFQNNAGVAIVNFPKQHIAGGEAKNAQGRTNGFYKPAVRMFKNARNRLIRDNVIALDSCRSYSVECFVFNAADHCFSANCQNTYTAVLDSLAALPYPASFTCQNGILPLFGDSAVQWNTAAAQRFYDALRKLWQNWR